MNNSKIYMLNSTGRQVFPFPWESKALPCPWKDESYMRVLVPLSDSEKIRSGKTVHTQIIHRSKITTFHSDIRGMLGRRKPAVTA